MHADCTQLPDKGEREKKIHSGIFQKRNRKLTQRSITKVEGPMSFFEGLLRSHCVTHDCHVSKRGHFLHTRCDHKSVSAFSVRVFVCDLLLALAVATCCILSLFLLKHCLLSFLAVCP